MTTIDAHQHFWQYSAAEYGWIDDSMTPLRRDFLPEELEREMTRKEWHDRLSRRPITDLGDAATSLLEQERQQRDRDLA